MFTSTKTANRPKSMLVKGMMIAGFLGLLISPAFALDEGAIKTPPLKQYEFVPQPEFEVATRLVSEKAPYNDDYLSYSMRLPQDWADNTQASLIDLSPNSNVLSSTILSMIGKFIAPPKNFKRSYVTVEAMNLDYEIGMKDWFVNFMVSSGYSIAAMTEKSRSEVEALYVQNVVDDSFVVRARVVLNGARLVMVQYYLPQDNYDDEKIQQAQVIDSFAFAEHKKENIEKHETYGFLDQSYFNYPASWELKERSILTVERMSATLSQTRIIGDSEVQDKDREFVLEGHIKINAISKLLKTSLSDEIKKFRDGIKIPGYKIGSMIENIAYDYSPGIKSGKAQTYALMPDSPSQRQAYEMAVAVMEGKDYYYITSLLTPSREQSMYIWARNMEAYRIVNESVRRTNVPAVDLSDPYYDYLKDGQ